MRCPHCQLNLSVSEKLLQCPRCNKLIDSPSLDSVAPQPQLTPLERSLFWIGAFVPLVFTLLPCIAWLDAWNASGVIPDRHTPITPLGKSFAWSSALFAFSWLGSPIVFMGGFARRSHPHVRKYLPLWIGAIAVSAVLYAIAVKVIWGAPWPQGVSILDWWHLRF